MRAGKSNVVRAFGLTCLLVGTVASAGERPNLAVDLKVGDIAPDFESTDENGKPWKLGDHVRKKFVVVYFFPADFTTGCTKQAESWRDNMNALKDAGVEVVGVSGDSANNHELFRKTWKLNFTLLADEKANIAKKFGVPVKKKVGRIRPRGPDRKFLKDENGSPLQLKRQATFSGWTFVIGREGKVAYKNTKVRPTQDSQQVLEFIEKSQESHDNVPL